MSLIVDELLAEEVVDIEERIKNDSILEYRNILKKKKLELVLKRGLDIILSVVLIVLLFPLMVFLGLWIKIDSKGTIFYKQVRVTTNAKKFKIIKFRTMVSDADSIGTLVTVSHDARVTKAGVLLRKYRLDEIPQLFNVLKGEMSFVGARPEVLKYVEAYSDEMFATLLMPAGITSMASIMYKDEEKLLTLSENTDDTYVNEILPEKMKYNVEYVRSFTMWNDIKIMLKTVVVVFR